MRHAYIDATVWTAAGADADLSDDARSNVVATRIDGRRVFARTGAYIPD